MQSKHPIRYWANLTLVVMGEGRSIPPSPLVIPLIDNLQRFVTIANKSPTIGHQKTMVRFLMTSFSFDDVTISHVGHNPNDWIANGDPTISSSLRILCRSTPVLEYHLYTPQLTVNTQSIVTSCTSRLWRTRKSLVSVLV